MYSFDGFDYLNGHTEEIHRHYLDRNAEIDTLPMAETDDSTLMPEFSSQVRSNSYSQIITVYDKADIESYALLKPTSY